MLDASHRKHKQAVAIDCLKQAPSLQVSDPVPDGPFAVPQFLERTIDLYRSHAPWMGDIDQLQYHDFLKQQLKH